MANYTMKTFLIFVICPFLVVIFGFSSLICGFTLNEDGFPNWVRLKDRKHGLSKRTSPSPSPSTLFDEAADIVVAKDGSGNYKTVKEAVANIPKKGGRIVIYVKAGVYNENVDVNVNDVTLVGDGIGKTIITGNKSNGTGSSTFNSATFAVDGSGFIARGITFQNTAGVSNGQAIAARCYSDFAVFYQCSIEGYQDTLFYRSDHQFYRECDIYGTVDFIFGAGVAVFQNCNIYVRNPGPNKVNTITADGRDDKNRVGGISFQNCVVTAAPDVKFSDLATVKTYLGRPWRNYATTVFMQTFLDGLIDPAGWLAWDAPLDTVYYGEYENYGMGASTARRVSWGGYHVINDAAEASKFTVEKLIDGDSWLPAISIPYTSGLS
ncbi:unnamed protein product [Cuscuta epithymum]|uniref:Pectinesterase n=1 Tax=Cuscuta epithymum TaxID=186058 RepID=A0AAV0FNH5_9ASTE|nr:unnamed protein product [Cuscuta epithymum]